VHWFDSDLEGANPANENFYATITLALGAIEELFSSDPEVDQFFYDKAVAGVVSSSASTIASSQSSLRVADGLDPTV
jgi:hypothetical protein